MNMNSEKRKRLKILLTELLLTLLFNSLIAIFLTILFASYSYSYFIRNFIYSQAIGLSIMLISQSGIIIKNNKRFEIKFLMIAILVGGFIGITLANWIIGNWILDIEFNQIIAEHPNALPTLLTCALVFGTIISYYFYARSTIAENNIALREASMQRLATEKQLTETELKLLQAQIEPHFLFNSLSNILSLIDEEPKQAKKMLESFTHYLRASLNRTRQKQTSLGDEIDLLRAYLDIHTIRFGERLRYNIEIPKALYTTNLPPLLLQPIVENAIKHGLAPKLEGGNIKITAITNTNKLEIFITDTGIGLQGEHGTGIGLNNIRARLRTLYGNQAKMIIRQNTPCGVQVKLTIPLSKLL